MTVDPQPAVGSAPPPPMGAALGAVVDGLTPRVLRQTDELHEVEAWFDRKGVPLFVRRYRPGQEAVRLVVGVLLVVGAFGMTVLPFLALDTALTALAPGVVILATIPLLRPLAALHSGIAAFGTGWRRVLGICWRTAYVGGLVWLILAVPRTRRPEWFDFVVTVGLLLSVSLVHRAANSPGRTRSSDRWATVALLVLVVILGLAGTLRNTGSQLERPLSALFVPPVGVLLLLGSRAVRTLAPGAMAPRSRKAWHSAALAGFAPLTVIVWVQVVLAPYLDDYRWLITEWALGVFAVALVVVAVPVFAVIWVRRGRRALFTRFPDWLSLLTLGVLGAVGYPLVVYVFGPGSDVWSAAGALALNVAYGLGALVVAVLGVHSVLAWAVQQPGRTLLSSVGYLVNGLGVVLVLLVLFGVTADVWQVAAAPSIGRFGAIIGLFAGATVLLLVYGSNREVLACASFDSAEAALTSAAEDGHRPLAVGHVHSIACEIADTVSLPADLALLVQQPGRRVRLNALTVMLVYQGIRLLLVGLLTTGFFAVLGIVAGTGPVLSAWQVDKLRPITGGPWYDRPWLRMAVLLGAASVLYVAAHSVYDDELHETFFRDVRGPVRRRFAVRVAYLYLSELGSGQPDGTGAPVPPPVSRADVRAAGP